MTSPTSPPCRTSSSSSRDGGHGRAPHHAAVPGIAEVEDGHDWRLDLETGEFWSEELAHDGGIEVPDHWEDPDRWEAVCGFGSRPAWRDMEEFALECEDAELGERLHRANQGRGAFGRFRRLLDDEFEARVAWRIRSERRRLGRARTWLADRDCRPALRGIDLPVLTRPDAG